MFNKKIFDNLKILNKFKISVFIDDVIEGLMNINEAAQNDCQMS